LIHEEPRRKSEGLPSLRGPSWIDWFAMIASMV
jgi:hypothetical protein